MKQVERKYFGMASEGSMNTDDSPFAVLPNQWINAINIRSGSTDKGATGTIESIGSTKLFSSNDGVEDIVIYDEGNEWVGSSFDCTANFTDTASPYHLLKDTHVSNVTNTAAYVEYESNTGAIQLNSYRYIQFFLKPISAIQGSIVNFYLNDVLVGSSTAISTFTLPLGVYAKITVALPLTSATFDSIRISIPTGECYIDYIRLTNLNPISIGSVSDSVSNRIISFISGDDNSDRIVCYDTKSNIEYVALFSSQVTGGLNFSKESPIHSAAIINGILYWPDGTNNQPREINIEAAIKGNYPSYTSDEPAYVYPIAFSEITLIKPTEINAPIFSKTYSGGSANYIYNNSFQFAFEYEYYTNEKSVIGIYSKASLVNDSSEIADTIAVSMNAAERIPQTVRKVNIIVRTQDGTVTGGNIANVIKTWDKEIPVDNQEISDQNSNIAQLIFGFTNSGLGSAVPIIDVLRQFDNVPNYSESLAFAKNRAFLANNTEGYDTPQSTSLSLSKVINSYAYPTPVSVQCFVGGSTYKFGTVFYDFAFRRCGVVTNEGLIVAIDNLSLGGSLGGTPAPGSCTPFSVTYEIDWTLSNTNALSEIPDWAYWYAPLRTLNQKTRFMIASSSIQTRYLTRDANNNIIYHIGGMPVNCTGIGLNTDLLVRAGLGYVFNEGDVARITNPLFGTIEVGVTGQDGSYIFCQPKNIGTVTSSAFVVDNFYFEIYTPYKSSINEPFYEVGQIYKINNPTTSSRTYSTLSGAFRGDAYVVERPITGYVVGGNLNYAQAMSKNDLFYKRWDSDIGKENLITTVGQTKKTQYVSWSDTIIPNTQINGLNTFRVGNETLVPDNCGAIRKLQLTSKVSDLKEGNVLLSICENETNSMYLGETQISDSTGANQFFSAGTGVIGTINTLKGSSGTINPESVTAYRGQVWWGDAINGRWTQYSENGLFFISSLKMVRFWKNWFLQYNSMTAAQIESLGGRAFIFSTVDPAHDELLISIPKLSNIPPKGYLPDYPSTIYPFDILDLQGKTIVYKLEQSGQPAHWQGAYSFNPEGLVTLNNQLYSFYKGILYAHNQTTSYNNFYGVQYKSKIMFTSNMFPSTPKVYNNIVVEANAAPTLVYFYNEYPIQQSSDLLDFDFKNLEGIWYATILRNKLIPTAIGFNTTGLLSGEKMRNVAMLVLLEFSINNVPLELKFIQLGFIGSVGNTI